MTDARVLITENTLVNDHVEYRVELQRGNGTRLSSISRRYREFTELHAQMLRFSQPFKVPSMPPKKYFGRTNPSFVKKRQQELQLFLDKLFSLMVLYPNADTAWRLLCLFLAVDQSRLKIPEAILSRNDPNGRNGISDSGYVDVEEDGLRHTRAAADGGVNFSGAGGGYGVVAKKPAVRTAEDIENERLDGVVNEFAKQTINVSRGFEERLRKPNPNIIKKISIDELAGSIREHIYTAPLFNPPKCSLVPKSKPDVDDQQGGTSHEQEDNDLNRGNGNLDANLTETGGADGAGSEEGTHPISANNVLIDVSALAQQAKDLQSNLSTLPENKSIAAESLVYHLESTESSAKS